MDGKFCICHLVGQNAHILIQTHSESSSIAHRSFSRVDRALVEALSVGYIAFDALVLVVFIGKCCETLALSTPAFAIAAVTQFNVNVGAIVLDDDLHSDCVSDVSRALAPDHLGAGNGAVLRSLLTSDNEGCWAQ